MQKKKINQTRIKNYNKYLNIKNKIKLYINLAALVHHYFSIVYLYLAQLLIFQHGHEYVSYSYVEVHKEFGLHLAHHQLYRMTVIDLVLVFVIQVPYYML